MDREDNNIESLFQDLVKESGYTGRQTEVIHPHVSDVSFHVNEAINVLRGNIQLSGSNIKTIAVTSSVANEGKSSIAFRLAKSMAGLEKRILFIDCDIRNSTIQNRYDIVGEKKGLSEYLCGNISKEKIIYRTDDKYLDMIFTGAVAPNPSELVSGPLFAELMEYKKMVEPYVCDVSLYLWNALKEGKEVLLEGQLGSLKDPDHGIYPMVTSSSTLAGYGAVGAGLPPYEIKQIVTVCKAYSSAVGAGAFVSEIFGEEADELRRRGGDGGEFGATTGRPRRMGWFDCVASKYGCRLQGTTDVAFTVLDVLGYLDEIPVCTGYEIDGKVTTDFPTTTLLEKAKPVLETLPGWKCDIRGIKKYEDLPENCRKYVEFVEKHIGFPITMISNGPGRDDIIYRNK